MTNTVEPLVGRCIVFDGTGWSTEGTILMYAPNLREKEEPWCFFDEPRFPWRGRDLKRDGVYIRENESGEPRPAAGRSARPPGSEVF